MKEIIKIVLVGVFFTTLFTVYEDFNGFEAMVKLGLTLNCTYLVLFTPIKKGYKNE